MTQRCPVGMKGQAAARGVEQTSCRTVAMDDLRTANVSGANSNTCASDITAGSETEHTY